MYSDHRTRYRAPTLGFLELCTNLQYLELQFSIHLDSTLIIGVSRPTLQSEAEELEMTEYISQKWMLFFDLQSLIKATALQTLNISLKTKFNLINDRVIKEFIKRIKEILPSSVQFTGKKRVGVRNLDGSEFHRYK